MKLQLIIIALLLQIMFATSCKAMENQELIASHDNAKPVHIYLSQHNSDSDTVLDIRFKIDDGWALYANQQSAVGLPLQIKRKHSENIANWSVHFPEPQLVEVDNGATMSTAYIYEKEADVHAHLTVIDAVKIAEVVISIEYSACKDVCMAFTEELKYTLQPMNGHPNTAYAKHDAWIELLYIAMCAVIGGMILNFMPCVLPVLSIKIMNMIKYRNFSKTQLRRNLACVIFGIIFSFILLAISVLLLKHAGHVVGWGMHFQEPSFIMFLIVVLIIFANNLWGVFEINTPGVIHNQITYDEKNNNQYVYSFFSGILSTLLATPCTAPFLSTATAFALTQSEFMIMFIYICIGLGMASPYVLIMITPNALKLFPKPGRWMDALKKFFAIILIITAVWLLYVLYSQLHLRNILLFVGLVIISRVMLLNLRKISGVAKTIILVVCISVAIITPNFIEQYAQHNILNEDSLWEKYDEVKLQQYLRENKSVLVSVTATWCVTCNYNKFFILEQPDLTDLMQKHHVILMEADYSTRAPHITSLMNKYQRVGIPLNIVFGPNNQNGIVLHEVLTAPHVLEAIRIVGAE